jgi:hypothetical protein
MNQSKQPIPLPRYRGQRWISPPLPIQTQGWLQGKRYSVAKERSNHAAIARQIQQTLERHPWTWPQRPVFFFSDMHADTDAFIASLVASGGIKKNGSGNADFKLTRAGKAAEFLIGGDCFDKGPSTLELLRVLRLLADKGARLTLLAGNHDVRMMLGIRSVGLARDPRTEHFFVRMGPKVIPFLREIHERYLDSAKALQHIPGTRVCRRRLFPSQHWFDEFPTMAGWVMPDQGIEREIKRLKVKMERFEDDCAAAGLSLRSAYAAAIKWQELFLHKKGEFAWFFRDMRLACRRGTFLFIHAGLDDRIARIIQQQGVRHLNREFRYQLQNDLFDFYYGPIANTIRTKYRETDMPLTRAGVALLRQKGIQSIVHGHLNLLHGQRIMLRKGMVNFECDSTMDRNTRGKEGLSGGGAAVTIFRPEGMVLGISADHPYIKVFDPSDLRRG